MHTAAETRPRWGEAGAAPGADAQPFSPPAKALWVPASLWQQPGSGQVYGLGKHDPFVRYLV